MTSKPARTATAILGRPLHLARAGMRAVGDYVDAPDPVVRACNVTALIVASNQPFYPFYVRFFAGDEGWITLLTLLSTPFFAAVPAIARKNALAGKLAVPVFGILNSMLATKMFGALAGIELFLIPCLLIAAIAADAGERLRAGLLSGALALAYLGVYLWHGAALHAFAPDELASLYRLNAFSVLCVTIYAAAALALARRERAARHDLTSSAPK